MGNCFIPLSKYISNISESHSSFNATPWTLHFLGGSFWTYNWSWICCAYSVCPHHLEGQTSKAMSPSKKKVAQALNDNQTTSRLKLNCWASMPNARLLAMQRWNRIHTWRQWVNGAICTFRPAMLLSASVSEVTLIGRPDWGGEGY